MSECGASLSELRQAENLSEDVRYRGSLVTKRCDCRNSNGLDPMCKCTKPPPRQTRITRSEVSVSVPPPQPKRIFTKTNPVPVPNFKSNAPKMGFNLNGDSIPIPERYKYRRQFQAEPDPNSQLHWMARPVTPPMVARNTKSYNKFEEPVPHHRRNHMMQPTEGNTFQPNLPAETTPPQQQCQADNADNFHGPEPNARTFQHESSVSAVQPSQEAKCMYKPNRGYNYDQINVQDRDAPPQEQVQGRQPTGHSSQAQAPVFHPTPAPVLQSVQENCTAQAQAPVFHPTPAPVPQSVQENCTAQAQAPASHPTPAPVPHSVQENCTVQPQAPASQNVQEAQAPRPSQAPVAATQCAQEPVQPSHIHQETAPTSASVAPRDSMPTNPNVPQRELAPKHMHDRPATPIPTRDTFAQDLEAAARAAGNVATHNMEASSPAPYGQAAPRDLPPCPDRFYPCSHC